MKIIRVLGLVLLLAVSASAQAHRCRTMISDVQYSTDATTNGTSFDVEDDMEQKMFILTYTVNTTGTLDVALEHSNDDSTFYNIISSPFTQVTSSSGTQTLTLDPDLYPSLEYMRPSVTVGGGGDYNVTLTMCYGVKE